jgi:single-stranded DNA-binding protein
MITVKAQGTVQRVRLNKLEDGRAFTNVDIRMDDVNGRPIFASIVYRNAQALKAQQHYRKGDELDVEGEMLNNSFRRKEGNGWVNSLRLVPSSLTRTARGPEVAAEADADDADATPMADDAD